MEKKMTAWILLGLFFLGAGTLFAAETVKKESAFEQIVSIEKRGIANFLTSPGEVVYAFEAERKDHPKAWPATYIPRVFTNTVIRWSSSVNDILVLPWYAAVSETTPLTRHFDLPDYVWEKE
jgi:hypothetical protein